LSEMVFRERKKRSNVTLNVTSLVDVLFLLLIFFMVTGTFKRAGEMQLDLPESSTSSPRSEGAQSYQSKLVLHEDGTVFLNDEPVELSQLAAKLKKLAAQDANATILLDAEAGARYGDAIHLMDLVREAGFGGVSVGTRLKTFRDETP